MFNFNDIRKITRRQPKVTEVIDPITALENQWLGMAFVVEPALPSQNAAGIVVKVSNEYSMTGEYELYVTEIEFQTWATWIPLSKVNDYVWGDYWQTCLNCRQDTPINTYSEDGLCPDCQIAGLEAFEELAEEFDRDGWLADEWYENHASAHSRFE